MPFYCSSNGELNCPPIWFKIEDGFSNIRQPTETNAIESKPPVASLRDISRYTYSVALFSFFLLKSFIFTISLHSFLPIISRTLP